MPAKPGNQNALKHGLYAKRFTHDEKLLLRRMPDDDLRQEIALLRVVTDRILGHLDHPGDDMDKFSKLVGSLTAAVTALNTTVRTHALLTGDYTPLNDADEEALNYFDPYQTESNGLLPS
jgi:hypothetical protein